VYNNFIKDIVDALLFIFFEFTKILDSLNKFWKNSQTIYF